MARAILDREPRAHLAASPRDVRQRMCICPRNGGSFAAPPQTTRCRPVGALVRRNHAQALGIVVDCLSRQSHLMPRAPRPSRPRRSAPPPRHRRPSKTYIKAVRNDLQGSRAEVIAKNVTLTSEQAAKFWPMFEKYQQEQNVIMDEQLKGLQQYVDTFERLDDAGALALLNAHLERDTRMVALRQRWLAEFQKGSADAAGRSSHPDRPAALTDASDAVLLRHSARPVSGAGRCPQARAGNPR